VARKLRKDKRIPAVLYGKGEEPTALSVKKDEFQNILKEIKNDFPIVTLQNEKDKRKRYKALIKSIQINPINQDYLSIEFQRVHAHQIITYTIPIKIVGEAKGVKEGGLLEHHLYEIDVKGSLEQIPPFIELDISDLGRDEALHVKDIKWGKVQPLIDEHVTIVSIVSPRKEEVTTKVEEEIEGQEEGEEQASSEE